MRRSYGIFYKHKNNERPVIPVFSEEIEKKKVKHLGGEIIDPQQLKSAFDELWKLMNNAHEKFSVENNGGELTKTISAITLMDVITMLQYNMRTYEDLSKALKSSSITDVATKITLVFQPLIRWKVKLHVFTGKNAHNELVHFHPYKLSSKVLSGCFLRHSYIIRDPLPGDREEELQNEYLTPRVKRIDIDGKPVKYTGKRHVSLANSRSCGPNSVQEYPIEEGHSLEYDSAADGKIVTIAFISPTILPESKVYDQKMLSTTRRIGFENEEHLHEFLKDVLFHLHLVKLKADLCSTIFSNGDTLTKNEEYLRVNMNQPNSIENFILPLLAEYILQDEDENNITFSSTTCILFSKIIKETNSVAVFNAITSSQQNIDEMISFSRINP